MELGRFKPLAVVVLIAVVAGLGWFVFGRPGAQGSPAEGRGKSRPAPVEVAAIERGPIELRRTFSGTLEAQAKFVVAPKVSGRVERMAVDLADTVRRGQIVAELDNDEYVQAVAQAQRDLLASRITEVEAVVNYRIALIELFRAEGSLLERRGVSLPVGEIQ